MLLCGFDLVAGKRVEIVGETDSCHVAEPWLPRAIAGRRGHLGPKFRGQEPCWCAYVVMTQMVVIKPCLRNRRRYQIPPVDGKGFPTRGVSTGLVRCVTAPPPHGAPGKSRHAKCASGGRPRRRRWEWRPRRSSRPIHQPLRRIPFHCNVFGAPCGCGRREAGIITGPVGSVGDALDNVLMESTVGLYKSELIDSLENPGPSGRTRRAVRRDRSENDDADEPFMRSWCALNTAVREIEPPTWVASGRRCASRPCG